MKTSTFVRFAVVAASVLGIPSSVLGLSASAASIDQVIVRQQWPWSTNVDVEYRLSGVTSPVDIDIRAYDGGTELDHDRLMSAVSGTRHGISKSGVGVLVIDPVKAFGKSNVVLADFKVKLSISDSAGNVNEVIYKIFDLATGGCTDVTRAELLDGEYGAVETDFGRIGEGFNTSLDANDILIWTGVTNDVAYKTTKLVMRKIPAKGKTTTIGCLDGQAQKGTTFEANSAQREVSFTNDYYMSVFELTEGQFLTLITNAPNSTLTVENDGMQFTVEPDRYVRPIQAGNIARFYLSRFPRADFAKGPFTRNDNSIIGNLRELTGLVGFDLPTEAVWEYACRAGTTNDYNNGMNYGASGFNFSALARYSANSRASASGEYAYNSANVYAMSAAEGGTAIVGSYKPNAWGLYDMHGNMFEMCLDIFSADASGLGGVDPWGPSLESGDNYNRVIKGGVYYLDARYATSSYRGSQACNTIGKNPCIGVRVCLTVY